VLQFVLHKLAESADLFKVKVIFKRGQLLLVLLSRSIARCAQKGLVRRKVPASIRPVLLQYGPRVPPVDFSFPLEQASGGNWSAQSKRNKNKSPAQCKQPVGSRVAVQRDGWVEFAMPFSSLVKHKRFGERGQVREMLVGEADG